MNTTTDPVTTARAAALFVSDISAADRPTRAQAEHAIGRSIRAHGGSRGCLADMAAYYGDYPELAVPRMAWARTLAEGLRHKASGSNAKHSTLYSELVLAA
jgi:hypothetical protein